MRGAMPLKTLRYYMDMKKFWWLKAGIALGGRLLFPTVPYSEGYFLEEARKFRAALKMPLIYVGGLVSRRKMEEVLDAGFTGLQVARALVRDTDFVNKLRSGETECSACGAFELLHRPHVYPRDEVPQLRKGPACGPLQGSRKS